MLVEDGALQETRDLLLFHRSRARATTWPRRKRRSRLTGLKDWKKAILPSWKQGRVAFAELQRGPWCDGVDVLRIDRQGIPEP